jgi:apolipoprotein N-acyltransferase
VPVFRLHQIIAYGAAFGEYYTYGLKAYLLGFGLWWVSWSLNLVFVAAGARAVVEVVALVAAVAIPTYAAGTRRGLEAAQRLFYYVGIPAWLALRLLA